jgi:urease accessory protein
MSSRLIALAAASSLLSAPALAHTGHGPTSGLMAGFSHPFGGLDHVLVISMVGIMAALAGQRALWAVPSGFIASMLAGGLIGLSGIGIPGAEAAIAASVVVAALVIAIGRCGSVPSVAALAACFALFHGYAHGAEIPPGADALAYGIGFLSASTALLGAGLLIGIAAERRRMALRWMSAMVAIAAAGAPFSGPGWLWPGLQMPSPASLPPPGGGVGLAKRGRRGGSVTF